MLFLLEHAPLKPWQVDVLSIIRDEAYYFAPQAQTKIMNEGWASYWHSTIMTRQGLTPADVINYCDHHSRHAGQLADAAESRTSWASSCFATSKTAGTAGRFGKEYDDCDDYRARRDWNTDAGLGREKIFEVRRIHNDLTFIDEFLTLDFCREHKLFSFGYNVEHDVLRNREPRVSQDQAAAAVQA